MSFASARPALRVRHLRKAYRDVVAVDNLDLDVRTGECFGLLGPNGAGKTTTIEICEGLTDRDSGEVEVLGMRWETDARRLRERLGIQLQETQLSEKLTVGETVSLFRSFFPRGPSSAERTLCTVSGEPAVTDAACLVRPDGGASCSCHVAGQRTA